MAVLAGQMGKHDDYVFAYQGQPVWQVNTKAWRKAVCNAGLEDFRWHDLRHTWASRHVQAGTPLDALQEMGGWSTFEMVQRYAHLSAGHLADHAERIVPWHKSDTDGPQRVVGIRQVLEKAGGYGWIRPRRQGAGAARA